MKDYSHWLRHAILFAVLATLGACGGEPEDETPAAQATGMDPCAGLSVDAAADLLGVDADELVRRTSSDSGISCSFRSQRDPGKVLAFSVRYLDNEMAATARLESIAGMLEKISPVERADAPGDAALFASGPAARRAVMRRGKIVVDMLEPTDPELQRRAMVAIVARL